LRLFARNYQDSVVDEVMNDMRHKYDLEPSSQCVQYSIQVYGAVGQWRRAFDMLKGMHVSMTPLSLMPYHHVIDALKESGEWRGAVTVLRMLTQRMKPTSQTYDKVMAACAVAEEWNTILSLFGEMVSGSNQLNPSPITCTFLIMAFFHLQRPEDAFTLMERMKYGGMKATPLAEKLVSLMKETDIRRSNLSPRQIAGGARRGSPPDGPISHNVRTISPLESRDRSINDYQDIASNEQTNIPPSFQESQDVTVPIEDLLKRMYLDTTQGQAASHDSENNESDGSGQSSVFRYPPL